MTGTKKDTLYITHSGELLIWLIILLLIVSFCTLKHINKIENYNDYNIYMQDVDGLIVGSPVRIMGIEVGHVTTIKPTNEEVFIKFVLDDKTIEIPQGTVATVEFNGMAGSKSLELYLPDNRTYIDENVPILSVDRPKRLHDALGLLNEMFEKIGAIIYTSSSFSNKVKKIDLPMGTGENVKEFINYSNKMLDDANKKASDFGIKINEVYKNTNK